MVVEPIGDFAETLQGIAIERSDGRVSLRSADGMSVERALIFDSVRVIDWVEGLFPTPHPQPFPQMDGKSAVNLGEGRMKGSTFPSE